MATPASFWTYKAPPTPGHAEAVAMGAFKGTGDQWESLTPGMRREIVRHARRRIDSIVATIDAQLCAQGSK